MSASARQQPDDESRVGETPNDGVPGPVPTPEAMTSDRRQGRGEFPIGANTGTFNRRASYLKRLIFALDVIVVGLSFLISIQLHEWFVTANNLNLSDNLGLLPIAMGIFAVTRYVLSRRNSIRRQTLARQGLVIAAEVAITVGVLLALVFLFKVESISRFVIITFSVSSIGLLVAVRQAVVWWQISNPSAAARHRVRVLIVGSGGRARKLAAMLDHSSEWGVDIVGFLDPKGESAGRRAGDEILGHVDQISQVLRDNVVEDVIVAVPRKMLVDVQRIVDACQEEGVRLRFLADFYDFNAAKIGLTLVNGVPLISFEPVARDESALFVKRIVDVTLTILALPLLIPIFLLVALAIKIDDPGPVFFVQERIGLHKRRFPMFKFRSMVVDAEARMREIEHLNEAEGPNFKMKDDPRVTKLGNFLRRSSIDELPQLINVLRGEMSLVGPRPMSIRDVDLFDKGIQRKRFSVRPGLTCLWQVSGRSDLDFDDWLRLDLEYIERWSLWLDIKILFRTVFVVLTGKGAV